MDLVGVMSLVYTRYNLSQDTRFLNGFLRRRSRLAVEAT